MKINPLFTVIGSALLPLAQVHAIAVWVDVTTGATAIGSSGNHPAGEPPQNAIDPSFYTKYLNFDKTDTGFTVTGANSAVPVTRMILVTANDAPDRDPASYVLEGSNDGADWTGISSGPLALPTGRNTSLVNPAVAHQSIIFDNSTAYSFYRVTFPTIRNAAAANSMQIAGVSLLGLFDPGQNVLGLQSYTASGFGGSFPGAESPANAIDNDFDTKYLNFGKVGAGLTVTTDGLPSVITGVTLSKANDAPARDVTAFTLQGSMDGDTFVDIVNNLFIPDNDMGLFESNTVSFENTTAYRDYRFIVTGMRSPGNADSFQFSEIQLHGVLVPEPGTTLLGLLGSLLLFRRRR